MTRVTRLGLAVVLVMTWGCAATSPTRFEGVSGGVAWEVVDIVQNLAADSRAIRWDYTIVLKETGGTAITFARLETQTQGGARSGLMAGAEGSEFRRRLEPNSELRLNASYTVYFTSGTVSQGFENPASRENYVRYLRYLGKSEAGAEVSVLVSFPLNTGVGRKIQGPTMTASLPPRRTLRPDELKLLAGTWLGGYRTEMGVDIPLRVTVDEGGSFEAAEGNPVRNRFSGYLSILDEAVVMYAGRDSGRLTFHEGGGQRVLVGQITGKRGQEGASMMSPTRRGSNPACRRPPRDPPGRRCPRGAKRGRSTWRRA